jgi:hypothetical protein
MSEKVIYQTTNFPTVLCIVFIVLKLCNVINWSWIWVVSPLWISIGVGLITLLIILLITLFFTKNDKTRL